MSMAKELISPDMKNFRSFMEARNPLVDKFCEECGLKCEDGQLLWNGWYTHKGVYHIDCMSPELKNEYGISR